MPTSSPSVRAQIGRNLADRLATVTVANGYSMTIRKVLYDDIELGMQLQDQHIPAVLVLDEGVNWDHDKQVLNGRQSYRLQLVLDEGSKDEKIYEMMRAIAKAIYANSPTAQRVDGWRGPVANGGIHEAITWVQLTDDITDLHMIKANRIATMRLIVHYRAKPYDL